MENKKNINSNLSDDQISEFSQTIIEIYGSDLSPDDLSESVHLILENVPGIELVSTKEIQLLILQIRGKYYDKTSS